MRQREEGMGKRETKLEIEGGRNQERERENVIRGREGELEARGSAERLREKTEKKADLFS